MNWSKGLRTCCTLFVLWLAALTGACGSVEESPTGPTPVDVPQPTSGTSPAPAPAPEPAPTPAPSPAPAPAPAPAPTPAPNGSASFSVTVTPNPVPWSSEPVPNCNLANRWHYDQVLRNTGGRRVTVSDRTDFFDGAPASTRSGLGIVLEPGAETTIRTRWCSANNIEHRAQTNWSGSDETGARIDVNGVVVRLLPR
jgi:hypothetical protein